MENQILKARIEDTAQICSRTGKPKYLGFLSCEEAMLAQKLLENRDINFSFFGGYDDAERVVLGCFPDWMEDSIYPIEGITFSFRKSDKIGHRDVLGSLMGLGIVRESVGDILIEEGRAVAFVLSDIAEYVVNQTEKIGRVGVTAKIGFKEPLPQKSLMSDFSQTVSSLRLDCVVSVLGNFSRAEAVRKIGEGLVSINSVVCEKITRTVSQDDIITIRGKGKFKIESLNDKTRKDRIILRYKKYT